MKETQEGKKAGHTSDKKIQKRIIRIFTIVGIVVVILIVGRVLMRVINPQAETQERVFSVAVEKVEPASLQEYFKVNGSVMADNTTNVLPDTNGKLIRYVVRVGQAVRAGQIIAYIDPSRPGARFELNPVTAPVAGTITSLPIELGNTVSTSSVVAQLGDLSKLKIEAYIPERYARSIHLNSTARLTLPAYPGVEFNAVVDEIAPVVDITSRTVLVKLYVTERSGDLMHGMFGSLSMNTYLHEDIVSVPSGAVLTRSGKNFMFIAEDKNSDAAREVEEEAEGKESKKEKKEAAAADADLDYDAVAKMVEVKKGVTVDGMTLIEEGIEFGETVVVQGQNLLTQGAKIKFSQALPNNAGSIEDLQEQSEAAPSAEGSETEVQPASGAAS
jgi:membrane fusion protein (multidrug efflux system)